MADKDEMENVIRIDFPEDFAHPKKILVNGVDLLDNPLPFRKLVLTIDLIEGDLPLLEITRIPPVN